MKSCPSHTIKPGWLRRRGASGDRRDGFRGGRGLSRQPPRKQLSLYGFTDREFPQVLMGKEDRSSTLCRFSVDARTTLWPVPTAGSISQPWHTRVPADTGIAQATMRRRPNAPCPMELPGWGVFPAGNGSAGRTADCPGTIFRGQCKAGMQLAIHSCRGPTGEQCDPPAPRGALFRVSVTGHLTIG